MVCSSYCLLVALARGAAPLAGIRSQRARQFAPRLVKLVLRHLLFGAHLDRIAVAHGKDCSLKVRAVERDVGAARFHQSHHLLVGVAIIVTGRAANSHDGRSHGIEYLRGGTVVAPMMSRL